MLHFLRIALATLALLICMLVGYMLFTFNKDYETHLAVEAFLKGDYARSEAIVQRLEQHLGKGHYHLLLSYIERAKQHYTASDSHLKAASAVVQREKNPALALEIALNQAYDAFLTHQTEALQAALKQATAFSGPKQEWVLFFSTINQADDWNHTFASKPSPLSPWMKKTFDTTFTQTWYALRRARRDIASGQTLKAREQLEAISELAPENPDVQLLIGLSYLKEAEKTPSHVALPYYKLAFGYFGRVPLKSDLYWEDREAILKSVNLQIMAQLQQGSFQDLLFYASALESLNERQQLHSQLIEIMEQELQAKNWSQVKEIALLLNRLVLEPQERQHLAAFFTNQLSAYDSAHFQFNLELGRIFSTDSTHYSQEIQNSILATILDLLPLDNDDLNLTAPQIALWLHHEPDPQMRTAFSETLLKVSEKKAALSKLFNHPEL